MARVSFSQYSTYSSCPQQYKLRYIDRLGESSANIYTIFGTGIHETIQEFLKVMYGTSKKAAMEVNTDKLLAEWMRKEYTRETEKLSTGIICTQLELEEFYGDGRRILEWFKAKLDKFYTKTGFELVGIEIPLKAKIKEGVEFIGFIDVVMRDLSDNSIIIIDLKTSTRGWNKYAKADKFKNAQIVLYKKYYSELFDIPLDKIKVEYQIMRRKLYDDAPFPIPYMSRHIPANGKPTVNKIYTEFNNFVNDVFDEEGKYRNINYPKQPGDRQKNCKFCEFGTRGLCDKIPT